MMTGNKMSDTTVNLRGSSKTMSLALALPIKMGRNKTHYLYQPQCSHVQRGYTAHVQMHPKNQIKLMTLIQWKYPPLYRYCTTNPEQYAEKCFRVGSSTGSMAFFSIISMSATVLSMTGGYITMQCGMPSNKPSPTEVQTWVHTFGIHMYAIYTHLGCNMTPHGWLNGMVTMAASAYHTMVGTKLLWPPTRTFFLSPCSSSARPSANKARVTWAARNLMVYANIIIIIQELESHHSNAIQILWTHKIKLCHGILVIFA